MTLAEIMPFIEVVANLVSFGFGIIFGGLVFGGFVYGYKN